MRRRFEGKRLDITMRIRNADDTLSTKPKTIVGEIGEEFATPPEEAFALAMTVVCDGWPLKHGGIWDLQITERSKEVRSGNADP